MSQATEDRDLSVSAVTYHVTLDAEDVVLGAPRSCHDDPIARAIKRAVPELYDLSVTRRTILLRFAERSTTWGRDGPAAWVELPTPPAVAEWLDRFDAEPADNLDLLEFELTFHPIGHRFRADRFPGEML